MRSSLMLLLSVMVLCMGQCNSIVKYSGDDADFGVADADSLEEDEDTLTEASSGDWFSGFVDNIEIIVISAVSFALLIVIAMGCACCIAKKKRERAQLTTAAQGERARVERYNTMNFIPIKTTDPITTPVGPVLHIGQDGSETTDFPTTRAQSP